VGATQRGPRRQLDGTFLCAVLKNWNILTIAKINSILSMRDGVKNGAETMQNM